MNDGINRLLSKQEASGLANLTIGSRFTVEGTLQGAHRSPLKGFSVEFADYRQYVPGDDLRHMDWRVYAKNERLYIRQYEEECNLRVYMMVDASRSMDYCGTGISKYRFASRLAAALAYVTVHQQDSVGLHVFDSKVRKQLPAKSGPEHLRILSNLLADHQPDKETDVAGSLHELAEQTKRRALVVIFSDLFDELDKIQHALAHFRRRKHDVVLFHVLDRNEVEFPFRESGAFKDPESGEVILTNPTEVRSAYQKALSDFLYSARQICASLDVDYTPAVTDGDLLPFVRRFLARRRKRS